MRPEAAEGLREATKKMREVDAIVGWLAGFSATVWTLSSVYGEHGEPLYADAAPAEYEEKVKRLADLIGVDL